MERTTRKRGKSIRKMFPPKRGASTQRLSTTKMGIYGVGLAAPSSLVLSTVAEMDSLHALMLDARLMALNFSKDQS